MSYATYEASFQSGEPVELYEFIQGTTTWRYSSGQDVVTYLSHTFFPSPITRQGIKQSTDVFKNTMTLTFPQSHELASQFIGFAPDEVTTLTIYRGHATDPAGEFQVAWRGRVTAGTATGTKVDIDCEPIYTSLQRPGLRARFEYTCRYAVYMRGCNVDKETKRFNGVASVGSGGLHVTVAGAGALGATYFVGGMLIGPDNIARFITAQSGDLLTLQRPYVGVLPGDALKLYPGCDGAKTTCITKFNNLPNYGGFPWIPVRNPFDGSSIA